MRLAVFQLSSAELLELGRDEEELTFFDELLLELGCEEDEELTFFDELLELEELLELDETATLLCPWP